MFSEPLIDQADGAHASLQTTGEYDYVRITREFSEEHAKVWDLVRRCYATEQADLPVMDAHRLAVKIGKRWLVALAPEIIEEGWLQHHPLEAQRLRAQLPNHPVAIAEASQDVITLKNTAVTSRAKQSPNVADLLRSMREEHIGRPSTYASHIESVFEMKDRGYVQQDDEGRLTLTALGLRVLQTLRERAFAGIGLAHCMDLDDDLDAIEAGKATPYDIAIKHLSLVMDLKDAAKRTRDMQGQSYWESSGANSGNILPRSLDPDHALPQDHRLRRAKQAVEEIIRKRPSPASTTEHSARRAAIAHASSFLWNLKSERQILEELQFNLAYRWLCDIRPEDVLWQPLTFQRLVQEQHRLRDTIQAALEEALVASISLQGSERNG